LERRFYVRLLRAQGFLAAAEGAYLRTGLIKHQNNAPSFTGCLVAKARAASSWAAAKRWAGPFG